MKYLKGTLVFLIILFAGGVFGQESVLHPIADTYIRGGSYADDNFGSVTELYFKGHPTDDTYERQMLFQFDLSGLQQNSFVTSARLKLYCNYVHGDHTATVFKLSDDWTEGTLTWNNAPLPGEEISSVTLTSASPGSYVEFDLASYISEVREGDQVLSIIIIDKEKANMHSKFSTKEDVQNWPELVLYEEFCNCALSKPADFSASVISATRVNLAWSQDACCAALGMHVERKEGDGMFQEIALLGRNINEFLDAGLKAETQYTYRIFSYGPGAVSEYSDEVSVTTTSFSGTDYFLDATAGDDGNDGLSESSPWQSLEKINSSYLDPGDRIFFKSGETWIGTLSLNSSGVDGFPISIGKYGEGDLPHIQGPGTNISSAIYLFNPEYWDISDLKVTNPEATSPAVHSKRAIYIVGQDAGALTHIHIKNVEITDVEVPMESDNSRYYGGIYIEILGSTVPTWFDDVLIEGCYFHHLDRTGLSNQSTWWRRGPDSKFGDQINEPGTNDAYDNWVPSENMVVRNCRFEHIGGNGLILRVSKNTLVEDNFFTYCGEDISGNAAFCFNTDSTLFQNNEASYTVYNEGDTDARGIDSDFRTKYTIIQYNFLHHNGKGGIVATGGSGGVTSVPRFNIGTIIRYNLVANNEQHIIRTSGVLSDMEVYNNVFYSDGTLTNIAVVENGNWGGAYANGSYYSNNIFNILGEGVYYELGSSENNVFSHNAYYGATGVIRSDDASGISGDPLFKSPGDAPGIDQMQGFKLKPGSPCIGSGIPIVGAPEKDLFGNALGSLIDIGVHQFSDDPLAGLKDPASFLEKPVRLFPNPASSILNVIFNDQITGNIEGVIYDAAGRKRFSFEREISGGSVMLNIHRMGLEPGSYLMKISDNRQALYSGIIIVK